MVGGGLGLIAYLVGNSEYSTYLQIPYIPGTGLSVFCGALIGAGLGFCGSILTQPKCLWVMLGPWRLGLHWQLLRL